MINNELNQFLRDYKIKAYCSEIKENSLSRIYDFSLLPGSKVKNLEKYSSEITMFLRECSEPTINIIYQQNIVRFEYIKYNRPNINFFDNVRNYWINHSLNCYIGNSLSNDPVFVNIADTPHILIAGSTGSGKSTLLNVLISNLLRNNVDTNLIDLKGIDFIEYNRFNNFKISSSYEEALQLLKLSVHKMNLLYSFITSGKMKKEEIIPSVIIIDEFADLIMQDFSGEFKNNLLKLIQKSRAVSIHVIIATQRPSVKIIDGNIKANIPVRIACRTSSGIDSRVILDDLGAEKLIGRGDSLMRDYQGNLIRFQSAYTTPSDAVKNLILNK